MHTLTHAKITKCGIFVKYNAKKSPKSLKTLHFRVLADASKLTTLANKQKGHPQRDEVEGKSPLLDQCAFLIKNEYQMTKKYENCLLYVI